MSEHTKVLIIGSGPSGYTAAVYASRAQLSPIQITGNKPGGQLMWTSEVENFPGFPDGKRGPDLMQSMRSQAEKFGTTMVDGYATAVDLSQRPFKVWTNSPTGEDLEALNNSKSVDWAAFRTAVMSVEPAYTADSIIISTGAASQMLDVPGEQDFLGRGVSTCAVCDAAFYRDKTTFVVGGGDSAMEDTLALTKFAKHVTLVVRKDILRASKVMQERVLNHPKVTVLWNSRVTNVGGGKFVTNLTIETTSNGAAQSTEHQADGLFIAIGHKPMTGIFQGLVQLDGHGYVVTRQSASKLGVDAARHALLDSELLAFPTMTSVEGVFAAGDVVDVRYKQAITAAGQGCAAALDAERWLESQE